MSSTYDKIPENENETNQTTRKDLENVTSKLEITDDETLLGKKIFKNKTKYCIGIIAILIVGIVCLYLFIHVKPFQTTQEEPISFDCVDLPFMEANINDMDICVNDRYLLLISLDGFQWGYYFNHTWRQEYNVTLPNMDLLINNGVTSQNVISVFPTLTFPNHVSIITGLYPGDHGIVANSFYDPVLNEWFGMSTQDTTGKWYQGTPIWQTMKSEENKEKFNTLGLDYKDKSGAIFWVGTDHNMSGNGYPDFWMPYDGSFSFENRIDTVIELLNTTEYRIIITYFSQPDSDGHSYGPDSMEVADSVMEMDNLLGKLIDGIQSLDNNIWDKTDILIASDHGMTEVKTDHIIIKRPPEFDLWNDDVNFIVESSSANLMITLTNDSIYTVDEVIELIKNNTEPNDKYQVWSKETIPYEYKTSYHDRIPDIIAGADLGYLFKYDGIPDSNQGWLSQKGTHGFNNSEHDMRSLFIGYGPSFKNGCSIETIKSLDYYELMCQLLCGLIPSPNNGSITSIKDVLSIQYN